VVEQQFQVVERQTGGGTPFRAVPAEFNHWTAVFVNADGSIVLVVHSYFII